MLRYQNKQKFIDNLQRPYFNIMNTLSEIFNLVSSESENLKALPFWDKNTWLHYKKKYDIYKLKSLYLLSIDKPILLLNLIGISKEKLQEIINNPKYKVFNIPKKKGGSRIIQAPNNELKSIQTILNEYLQSYYYWIKPSESHGFTINPNETIKTCNILENAKPHVGKNYVLNLDLKDFFPSISANKVYELFTSELFKFNEQIATLFTLLLTNKGFLPIGSPSSPVISNFICISLDNDLLNYAIKNQLTFTRYADDLTFSSNQLIDKNHIEEINQIIANHHFQINHKKTRISKYSSKQVVTGLTVNEKPNIDRVLLKKIRAMVFDLQQNGIESASKKHFKIKFDTEKHHYSFFNKLGGYINFMGQIKGTNDKLYLKYQANLSYALSLYSNGYSKYYDIYEDFDGFNGDLMDIRVPPQNTKSNL
jgi:RNA-directed DNA polymerase